jgi:uncharacterized ion transporter superfamily protein YfcC
MGIQVVIREDQILDTMLHIASMAMEGLPMVLAAEGMFLFQSVLNFFIPSPLQFMVSIPLMVLAVITEWPFLRISATREYGFDIFTLRVLSI